jgi:hypothetical protein
MGLTYVSAIRDLVNYCSVMKYSDTPHQSCIEKKRPLRGNVDKVSYNILNDLNIGQYTISENEQLLQIEPNNI